LSLSLYDASIPGYARMLRNLAHIMDKAETWASEQKVPLDTILQTSLGHGMANFTRQIQMASDAAKGGAARLAGIEPPAMPDTEAGFPDLKTRIEKTVAFVESVTPDQVNGDPARPVVLKFPNGSMDFTAQSFLLTFSLPNFHFHVTTAYDILRSLGVPLSKMDYLAGAKP
jgi:hypothetical protein